MQRRLTVGIAALFLAGTTTLAACKKSETKAPSSRPHTPPPAPPPYDPNQVGAPADFKAPPPDAEKRPSGLVTRQLAPGMGTEHAQPIDSVKIHYVGWSADGKMIKNTFRGEPEQFQLAKAIKGWIEGIPLMVEGEKRRFWIPAPLTVGATAQPSAAASAMVFDVQLLHIEKGEPSPSQGELAQPKDVQKTPSGLVYKVIKKGTGKFHPKANNTVEVHYTGWTRDGKEYDSSIRRGRPAKMQVSGVFPGWAEALPLMVVGDKTRFWFPAKLAFGTKPPTNAPAGGMVFDIELLGIE